VVAESFGEALRRLRQLHGGISLRELSRRAAVDPGHLSRIEAGQRPPTAQIAAALDHALDASGKLAALAAIYRPVRQPAGAAALTDDELDAYDLAGRVDASDVSDVTLGGLDRTADQIATAYHATPPARLLPEVRRYLTYVAQLVDKRMTLAQRRQLLTAGGWLSLLAATLHIDLHQRPAAAARLTTARSLAEHAGHDEIGAWCLETQAWDAVTEGRYRTAVELSRAAQHLAPAGSSARIQAIAQEGRAWAKLGDRQATGDALRRVERLVSPLAQPDQPEHHYRYDPDKQLAYTATTLAWVGDPAAVGCVRDVLARLDPGSDGGQRPRRAASARIDLALALVSAGELDEASGRTLEAIGSGRIVPSNTWRVAEVVAAVEHAGAPGAADLRDAYQTLLKPSEPPES
jgi:transcriptional regulator with XRE-family HTH domain